MPIRTPAPITRLRVSARRAALLLLVTLLILPAAPALAYPDLQPTGSFNVVPGLARETYRWGTPRGSVNVQVLRFRRDDPNIALKPELSDGHVPGREGTHQTLQRLGPSAVAGVNANFFFSTPGPFGEPEGLFIRNGQYISEPETKGRGYRGAFALFPDGNYDVGLPSFSGRVVQPDGVKVHVNGINQHPARPNEEFPDRSEVTVLTPSFGRSTLTPPGTTELVVPGMEVRPVMEETATITATRTSGNTPIPRNGVVIAASGQTGRRWAEHLRAGQEIGVLLYTDLETWTSAAQAVGAGPLIIEDGKVTPESSWNTEGFGPRHNRTAHPRTIIAFRDNAEVLLVTVDGRQPDRSVGLTTADTAHLMQHLDVEDAVMLDGGGSTTMSVDGGIVNAPCCDRDGFRGVGSSLVLWSNVEHPDVIRVGDYNRYATARAIANKGWAQGSDVAVLASGENFPDALAGGPFAAKLGAPLVLTAATWLPWSTHNALRDLGTRRILVLGGPGAVSDSVVKDLRKRGYRVDRVAGTERTQTAAAIALRVGAPDGRVFLASASNYPDALSAAVPAHRANAPMLTTWTDQVSDHTLYALRELKAREVIVVGGPRAVSEGVVQKLRNRGYVVTRVAGPNRYATSTAVVDWAAQNTGLDRGTVAVATGTDYPDALVGGPLAAKLGVPVLLTDPLDVGRSTAFRKWLDRRRIDGAYVFGGRNSVATWVAHQLQSATGG